MVKLPLQKLFKAQTLFALGFFLIKKIYPFECHSFYQCELDKFKRKACLNPKNYSFIHLTAANKAQFLNAAIEQQLNLNSGHSVADRLAAGGKVFFVLQDDRVSCQLCMTQGQLIVDTPFPLKLHFGDDSWFLSFLYTNPIDRGFGLANSLIEFACSELKQEGGRRCIAHIRSTNLASIYAFEKAQWHFLVKLFSSPAKFKLFRLASLEKHQIKISRVDANG